MHCLQLQPIFFPLVSFAVVHHGWGRHPFKGEVAEHNRILDVLLETKISTPVCEADVGDISSFCCGRSELQCYGGYHR
jgi:hypothetical protein